MTFKKKDPELVTLHLYAADDKTKTRAYRVAKYKDFVTALQVKCFYLIVCLIITVFFVHLKQKHMERFK